MAKLSDKPLSKSEISKIVKEIKVKFKDYFDSGYLSVWKREENEITDENLASIIDKENYPYIASRVIFMKYPTATYVIKLGIRDNNVSIKNKDSITAFLRRKGFEYTEPGMAYRI